MPWILMIALHVRATWSGLTFAGLAGLGGWAVGQMFFAGLVVLFAVCARSFPKVSRFLIIPLALIAFALVLASWSTRTTGDTFHIFATEAGKTRWAMLLSSATALLDRWIVFDSILALAAVVTLFWYKPDPLRRRKAAIAATCASALVLFGARYEPKDARVESPLLALARSHGTIRPPSKLDSISDIRSLRYGSINISDLTREELRKRREVLIQEGRQPNVVLVFMESTGYRQIQPGGQWNPSLTPTLYSLSRNGVLFSSVYAPFPGTVRAHLSVMTGGKMITWGSVYDELTHRYLGPTLPGELKKRGYRTGFFSAAFLDSENMDGFYDLLPFDEKLIPERMPKDYQRQHAFNSWGIDDREVADKALAWAQKGSEPFFGVINLDATHHPYDVPGDFPSGQTDNEEARFENALHFTDYVLGRLVEGLSRSAMNDTLILVIGDHGESFGELHPGNFTHRNFIYEENVRSFLLVADVKKKLAPFTAEFPASHADVLPTTLDLLDARGDKGSLFEPKPVIEYFYKNTYPELWGLRDGQWKFIESVLPGHDSELYRLDQDPHESHNIASQYPDRMRDYHQLVTQWYLDTQNDFVSHLENYRFEGGEALKASDLIEPGPKRLTFGTIGKDDKFTPAETVSVKAKIAAYTKDVPYEGGKLLTYRWTAPDGSTHEFNFLHEEDWSDVYVYPQQSFKMKPGLWRLLILDGAQELIRGELTVTP